MSIFNSGVNPFKKTKVVPIFYTITNDYAKYAAASINSLMKHTNSQSLATTKYGDEKLCD